MAGHTKPQTTVPRSRLGLADTLRVGGSGLRTRIFRAVLSTVGITIGIATLVGILSLAESGSGDLIKELDALGTNLLTVEAGGGFKEGEANLPSDAAAMIRRIAPVYEVSTVERVPGGVYRNDLIDEWKTQGITIFATDLNLLKAQRGTLQTGVFLSDVTSKFPAVVLGAVAGERLGIRDVSSDQKIWLGQDWFTVIGILNPLNLAADLDRGAIIGYESAEKFLNHEYDGHPDVIYMRAYPEHINDVRSVMAATVNPGNPDEVLVSRSSDVLEARIAAQSTFKTLFIGLGAVALLIGGIGIANVMIIAVIERRNEIGLRRALGATRFHIGTQFLSESLLLSSLGGITGILAGVLVTAIYAATQNWSLIIPNSAIIAGMVSSVLIGSIAGFYPAIRAANMPPTEALRTM